MPKASSHVGLVMVLTNVDATRGKIILRDTYFVSNQHPAVIGDIREGIRCVANICVRLREVNDDDLGVNFRSYGNPFTSTLFGTAPGQRARSASSAPPSSR